MATWWRSWPTQRIEELVRMYAAGNTFEEIGAHFGYAARTCRQIYSIKLAQRIRKRLGIPLRRGDRFWSEARLTELVWLHYELGWTFEKCAAHFGRDVWGTRAAAYRRDVVAIRKTLGLYRTNARQNLLGKRFGKLRVTKFAGRDKHRQVLWHCRCSCGGHSVVLANNLRRGISRSCGCLARLTGKRSKHYKNGRYTKRMVYTTRSWTSMRRRCLLESDPGYEFYGAKGVRVCQRMQDFDGFIATVGRRPKDKSLDRLNPHFHYSCGACEECKREGWTMNVKWSTDKQQANNKRRHYTPEQVAAQRAAMQANAEFEAYVNAEEVY